MRADFYLLTTDSAEERLLVACRLLEKAYQREHRVFVYCDNQNAAHTIDELLWTFKAESFIPHNLQGEGPEPPPPIQIGHGEEPRGFNDILLNLAITIPPFYARFKRVIEIIAATDPAKEIGREHYKTYRAYGLTLHTHKI